MYKRNKKKMEKYQNARAARWRRLPANIMVIIAVGIIIYYTCRQDDQFYEDRQ